MRRVGLLCLVGRRVVVGLCEDGRNSHHAGIGRDHGAPARVEGAENGGAVVRHRFDAIMPIWVSPLAGRRSVRGMAGVSRLGVWRAGATPQIGAKTALPVGRPWLLARASHRPAGQEHPPSAVAVR